VTGQKAALETVMTTQRAVRDLLPDPVDLGVVLDCIRLATHAPSGSNAQAWDWIVVTDEHVKRTISELNRPAAEAYAARSDTAPGVREGVAILAATMHHVPVIVIPCYRRSPDSASAHHSDAAYYGSIFPAVQNFLLALHARGLGATITTMALRRLGELRAVLALPDDVFPNAVIPVGWPRSPASRPPSRRPAWDVSHLDRYGIRFPRTDD
jgi:nitroreductase